MHQKSLFIFRRDLRLVDNLGLLAALNESEQVIPLFILTPEQLKNNEFFSSNCVQFMMESLVDLDRELKKLGSRLFLQYGEPNKVVKKLVQQEGVDCVYVNMDYTPYSTKRDVAIAKAIAPVELVQLEDALLNEVDAVYTGGGTHYTKFTPYFNKAKKLGVDEPVKRVPRKFVGSGYRMKSLGVRDLKKFYRENPNINVHGGRKEGLKIIRNLSEFRDYNKTRNDLPDYTTHLSAYNKFGCLSIREVYHAFRGQLGMRNDLIKQLYWRDFYYQVLWHDPVVLGKAMKEQYRGIKWSGSTSKFNKWKDGMTGFPIVDAGMRQMNETGFMHNRARLIVSNFLIKLLHIDWRKGEKYFAQMLVDYDPAVNNGNWQWGASTGADSQPYFRIFNPWLQSKKFDPQAEYIKRWVPELQDVPSNDLHVWDQVYGEYDVDYPDPIIDYKKAREEGVKLYKKYVG